MAKVKKLATFLFLTLLAIAFTLPSLKSGLTYSFGIGFWGPSGHDGVWHLALINHITNPFKIPLPIFSGQQLHNYHPFFDILAAFIARATSIKPSLVLFQILPLIISIGIIFISYLLAKKLYKSPQSFVLLPVFLVISNSFGWLVTLVRSGTIGGESMFWSMQSPSIFFNPPLALSFFFVLLLIYVIILPPKPIYYLLSFIILALLPITKAYSAPFAFSLYGLYTLFELRQHRYGPLLVTGTSLAVAIGLYVIYNPLSNGVIQFQPFWFVSSMLDSPDRLYLPRLASALHSFTSGHSYFKLTLIYLFAIPVFYLGNFGTRILGIFRPFLRFQLHYYLLPSIILTSLIPLLFVQNGTAWNTIQFLYYPLFFSSILFVNYLDNLKLPRTLKFAYIDLLLILNLIPSLLSYRYFITPTASAYITPAESQALSFLSSLKSGIVLTYPYDKYAKDTIKSTTGLPLWAYETTSYVAAYSNQQLFMADEMNLGNSGYDWITRRQQSLSFFKQSNEFQDRGFLVNNQIDYIYLVGNQINQVKLDSQKMYLSKIFDNNEVQIYQVQR